MTKNHTLQRTDTHARTRTHTDANIHTQHTHAISDRRRLHQHLPLNQQEWEEPAGGGGAIEMCLGELFFVSRQAAVLFMEEI